MPDFSLEEDTGRTAVAGLDEVGRGPLAGPVVACALVLDRARAADYLGLDDSKRLSRVRREALLTVVERFGRIGLGRAEVAEIDAHNILRATMAAMERAVAALDTPAPGHVLVDGNRLPGLAVPATAVVKGDGKSLSIAAASIVAKVHRDREMAALAQVFPGYGWERNAGYGTADHRAALARLGPTPHHRMSFRPVREAADLFKKPS